jgi:hypothetical protein
MEIKDIQELYKVAEGFTGDFSVGDIKVKRSIEVVPDDLTIHVYNEFCIPIEHIIVSISIRKGDF